MYLSILLGCLFIVLNGFFWFVLLLLFMGEKNEMKFFEDLFLESLVNVFGNEKLNFFF